MVIQIFLYRLGYDLGLMAIERASASGDVHLQPIIKLFINVSIHSRHN
jgi:hypothetical protein